MNNNELYIWNFCKLINNKLGYRLSSNDFIHSDNLNELINKYPDFYIEYKEDGLLHPGCYADKNKHELTLFERTNKKYKNKPCYYAILKEKPKAKFYSVCQNTGDNDNIVCDMGFAYISGHYAAGMERTLYNDFKTYWRCISNNKNIAPFQCSLIHKKIYGFDSKICAGKSDSKYKIIDYNYNKVHCTAFSPNYDIGTYFNNKIIVITTDKKLLRQYILFYTGETLSISQKIMNESEDFFNFLKKSL